MLGGFAIVLVADDLMLACANNAMHPPRPLSGKTLPSCFDCALDISSPLGWASLRDRMGRKGQDRQQDNGMVVLEQ